MKKFLVVLKSFILSRITIITWLALACLCIPSIVIAFFGHNHVLDTFTFACIIITLVYGAIVMLTLTFLVDISIINSAIDAKKKLYYAGVKTGEPAAETTPVAKTEVQSLLILVGTVNVAATTTRFIAKENFVVNTSKSAPVRISDVGESFNEWFLDKEEQPFIGSTLRYGRLVHSSIDGLIISELGGERKAETTLTELFALMQSQSNGENGPLLTNGYANIFYIKDVSGLLRAVFANWNDYVWFVHARAATYPFKWRAGNQVFFHDSR